VLPRLSFVLSKDALAVYFVHLLLVYGCSSYPSLFQELRARMTPPEVFLWIGSLYAAMTAMAFAIGRLRATRPTLLAGIRHALIVGGLLGFVFLSHLTPLRVAASLACGAAAVFMVRRLRTRLGYLRVPRRLAAGSMPVLRG
jgi:hypothetical protein